MKPEELADELERLFTKPPIPTMGALANAVADNLPTILSSLRRGPCPACAAKRQQQADSDEALAVLRDRGMVLSAAQNARADIARQALTGEA